MAAFLLFAAALLVVGPAEASRTTTDARSNLAPSSSLELPPLGPVESIDPVESSRRFGFAEDLGLLDPEAGPGGFVVFAAEAAQCELTYARNNPLKYIDPDGRENDVAWHAFNREQIRETYGDAAVARTDRINLAIAGTAVAGLAGGAALVPAEATLGGSVLPGVSAEVFALGAGPRGRIIERVLGSLLGGATLHPNFPVIDRFANGIATSVKSLDLAASSYMARNGLFNTLAGYVNKLAGFSERTFAGKSVGGADAPIVKKVLELVMQKGLASPAQVEQLRKAQQYANANGVEMKVYWVAK